MLSASRWFVGSSSSSTSGCCNRSRHSATRRRSPPERCFTGSSASGQRSASIARSSVASRLPAVFVIDLLGQLALSLDQLGHLLVVHRLHETGVDLLVLLEQRDHVGAAFLDHLADRLRVVQMRFLLEIADRVSGRKDDFALKVLVYSGDDFHQRRLARPVQADDADLRAVEKRQVNVVQYLFLVRESLADPHHREYDFFVRHRFSVGEFRVDRKDTQKRWNITAEISAIRSFYSGRPLRPGSTLLKNTGRLSNTEGSEKYGPSRTSLCVGIKCASVGKIDRTRVRKWSLACLHPHSEPPDRRLR